MRRLITSLLALGLAVAAFALAACGGDDNKTTSGQPTLTVQQPGTAQAPTGPSAGTTGQSGGKKKSRKSKRSSSGSNAEPQQTNKKAKKEKLSKAIAEALSNKGEDKVSYEAARQVCRERPLKEIRQTYKVKRKGSEAIADKVGRTYYPKRRAEAAKAGCLKGLSER